MIKKINWGVRFKNKVWLTTFVLTIVTFAYQLMNMLGIVPPIPEDSITQTAVAILDMMALLGIVIDPTTAGYGDSTQAMEYTEPRVTRV